MKLLLYCTKAKPYIAYQGIDYDCDDTCCSFNGYLPFTRQELYDYDISLDKTLNGKIVAECDFEVEEIPFDCAFGYFKMTNSKLEKSCLSLYELNEYLNTDKGYAIHINNLHIFDKPRELYKCLGAIKKDSVFYPLQHSPQNMMYVYERKDSQLQDYSKFDWTLLDRTSIEDVNKYILISIRPEWLCKILNGEKTIEVRKKVLKEML